jgi:hypothetical protein
MKRGRPERKVVQIIDSSSGEEATTCDSSEEFEERKRGTNKGLELETADIDVGLEPDHEKKPLWITDDGHVFLEVKSRFTFF